MYHVVGTLKSGVFLATMKPTKGGRLYLFVLVLLYLCERWHDRTLVLGG